MTRFYSRPSSPSSFLPPPISPLPLSPLSLRGHCNNPSPCQSLALSDPHTLSLVFLPLRPLTSSRSLDPASRSSQALESGPLKKFKAFSHGIFRLLNTFHENVCNKLFNASIYSFRIFRYLSILPVHLSSVLLRLPASSFFLYQSPRVWNQEVIEIPDTTARIPLSLHFAHSLALSDRVFLLLTLLNLRSPSPCLTDERSCLLGESEYSTQTRLPASNYF